MNDSEFVAYVGIPDIHDGFVLRVSVEKQENIARVVIEGYSGREHTITFEGATEVDMNAPEGMPLYALCEFTAKTPMRRFVFANNNDHDENENRSLAILAKGFRVQSA